MLYLTMHTIIFILELLSIKIFLYKSIFMQKNYFLLAVLSVTTLAINPNEERVNPFMSKLNSPKYAPQKTITQPQKGSLLSLAKRTNLATTTFIDPSSREGLLLTAFSSPFRAVDRNGDALK